MLKHADIWRAIDRLAAAHGLSPSALARKAGLDATTFNRSKRVTVDGKLRWPSTESLAKVMEATNTTLPEMMAYLQDREMPHYRFSVPVIGLAQAGESGFFDDAGFPTGGGWDEVPLLDINDPNAYALEISGDSMEPVYRDGDVVIVSPAATCRRGDRVVVRTHQGEVMAKQLQRRTATRIELKSLNPLHKDRILLLNEVAFISRIVWAGQ